MLVELDEILQALHEHGRLPTAAVASTLDLHVFDVRIALWGAATWGLVRRDGRGAWMLTERGRAAVTAGPPVATRPRPLHRVRRPVLAAWALAAVAAVAIVVASWASRPAAPSAGSQFTAASGTTSRAFVGVSRSGPRRSRAALGSSPAGSRTHPTTTSSRLPTGQSQLSPRVVRIVPRAVRGARPGAIVLARVPHETQIGASRPTHLIVRALQSGGHRLVTAPVRAARKRRPKHRAVVRPRAH